MTKDAWVKIGAQATTVLVTIVLTMTGFWMMIGREFVTRSEARDMIAEKINHVDEGNQDVKRVIQKNTDAQTHKRG